mmetsp:Transcript_42738/g.113470  ORF Transcript_42738/g.113470 Transcript_42738/m.113470 type:complete len:310 (+) Transcript_42738:68-997(+)
MTLSWRPALLHSAEDTRSTPPKNSKNKMKHVKRITKVGDTIGTNLCREWEGDKGETYLLDVADTGKYWTCTRWGADGCSKTFTVVPDEASGKIWWGRGASFYCKVGAEAKNDVLTWYRPSARTASFVWRAKPGAARSPRLRSESTSSGGESTAAELSCRSLSRSGSAEKLESRPQWRPKEEQRDNAGDQPCEKLASTRPSLPEGFQPPPGLEAPDEGGSTAGRLHEGPLDGRWFDSCGTVGIIAGSTMHWAHRPDDSDGTTEVVLTGATVHMTFLGQTLSGVLRDEQIIWSKSDVWWRAEPESRPKCWQ